LKATLKNIN